jgi:hypothetical protein
MENLDFFQKDMKVKEKLFGKKKRTRKKRVGAQE